jgi:hypothetical protein
LVALVKLEAICAINKELFTFLMMIDNTEDGKATHNPLHLELQ